MREQFPARDHELETMYAKALQMDEHEGPARQVLRRDLGELAVAKGGIVRRNIFMYVVHGICPELMQAPQQRSTLASYDKIADLFGRGLDGGPIVRWWTRGRPFGMRFGGVIMPQETSSETPPRSPLEYTIFKDEAAYRGRLRIPLLYGRQVDDATGEFSGDSHEYIDIATSDNTLGGHYSFARIADHASEISAGEPAIFATWDRRSTTGAEDAMFEHQMDVLRRIARTNELPPM